jgi:transglutaminase-like putative cysteine protease
MVMKYNVQHTTRFLYSEPTPVSHNQVHLAPRSLEYQTCGHYELKVDPTPAVTGARTDYFGNRVDYFSIHESHHGLTVTSRSEVEITRSAAAEASPAMTWDEVQAGIRADRTPEGLLAYQCALPSARVKPLGAFREYADKSFTTGRSITDAARDLTGRIHADFKFDPRATMVHTPPAELFSLRRGVCQDFAHFALGCVRSMGLPARYVSGYVCTQPPPGRSRLQGADASHAWFSIYCGPLGWIDFDPTNDVVVGDAHVTVAWGRDYDDICPIQGVFLGGGQNTMTVEVDVVPMDENDGRPEFHGSQESAIDSMID